jgi:hypothetical protein
MKVIDIIVSTSSLVIVAVAVVATRSSRRRRSFICRRIGLCHFILDIPFEQLYTKVEASAIIWHKTERDQ